MEGRADSRVEICAQTAYSSFRGDTPCSDQPLFFQTVTDADGHWFQRCAGRVLHHLSLRRTTAAKSLTEFGLGSERVPIIAGEDDIGTITLDEE